MTGVTEQEESIAATVQGNSAAIILENEQYSESMQDTPTAGSKPATAAAADDAQQTAEIMPTVQGGGRRHLATVPRSGRI